MGYPDVASDAVGSPDGTGTVAVRGSALHDGDLVNGGRVRFESHPYRFSRSQVVSASSAATVDIR